MINGVSGIHVVLDSRNLALVFWLCVYGRNAPSKKSKNILEKTQFLGETECKVDIFNKDPIRHSQPAFKYQEKCYKILQVL
jgi:hypothetical protein